MSILSVSKINKFFSNVQILKDISFFVDKNDKLAIIGKNGAGKTTLLKIICGIEDYDSGEIHLSKSAKIGYMEQSQLQHQDSSILSYCMNVFEDLMKMERELSQMEEKMATFDKYERDFHDFLHQYEEKTAVFNEAGGLVFKSKVKSILTGLGFEEAEHSRKISTLSGGQVNRLNLARLIASEPELLILDEPTNHLDMKSVAWLESYLKNYPNPIIFVSHDRYFIDAIANKTMEIELGRATIYKGNYSDFKKKSEEIKKAYASAYEKQQEEIKKQEDLITLFKQRGTEKLAKRAKSREKALEKIDLLERPEYEQTDIKIRFHIARSSGKDVLLIEHLSKSYSKPILQDVNLNVYKNQKIGIIGDNGSGKSTLLKLINSEISPDSGHITYGHNVDISYYDQNLSTLNPENTVLQEIVKHYPKFDDTDARTFLGRLLFFKDDVFKQIKHLSGGEKARVTLGKLLLNNSNFLLLDEPTNHLDLYTSEILEAALKEYPGTICVISHDRYFLNAVCDNIWKIEDGKVLEYIGNYDDYINKSQMMALGSSSNSNTGREQTSQNQESQSRSRQNQAHQSQVRQGKNPPVCSDVQEDQKTVLSSYEINKQVQKEERKKQRAIEKLEAEIQEIERKMLEIDEKLCEEDVYSDHVKSSKCLAQKKELELLLEEKYEMWENLN